LGLYISKNIEEAHGGTMWGQKRGYIFFELVSEIAKSNPSSYSPSMIRPEKNKNSIYQTKLIIIR
jgi:hypothetical protein